VHQGGRDILLLARMRWAANEDRGRMRCLAVIWARRHRLCIDPAWDRDLMHNRSADEVHRAGCSRRRDDPLVLLRSHCDRILDLMRPDVVGRSSGFDRRNYGHSQPSTVPDQYEILPNMSFTMSCCIPSVAWPTCRSTLGASVAVVVVEIVVCKVGCRALEADPGRVSGCREEDMQLESRDHPAVGYL